MQLARCLLIGLLVLSAATAQKRIYIAPDDHTDYLWTADEEAYRRAFIEMIDYYLDQAERTAGNPPEHRGRWNCDGSLWVRTYEQNKTPEEFARLVRHIKAGNISVPLNALVSCYGAQPAEAVLRGMFYAGTLERRFDLHIPLAVAMEDQTLPMGLGALWAGAGARYSWKGICGCATRMKRNERRPHEVYWWKGLDSSRILMKWYSLLTDNKSVGGYAEARDPAASVEFVDQDARFRSIHPYPVIGVFGKGWDDLKTLTDEFVEVARAKSNESRKVIVSNEEDYFRDLESQHGAQLPEFGAAFGNEWDLYSASLAEVSARVRRAVEKLRSAEALAVMVGLKRPELLQQGMREQAWMNLGIYWEHNWTADGKTIERSARAAWQRRLAGEIESYVDGLYRDSAYALGDLIERAGEHPRFYVFNPLNWSRAGAADFEWTGDGDVHVVDLQTGREAPAQLVRLADQTYQQGRRYLRIWAEDVPSVGYKVFEVRTGSGRAWTKSVRADGGVLENELVRLRVAGQGAIESWVDKQAGGREMVREIDGRTLNDLGPGQGELVVENAGPVSVTLRARSESPLRHVTRVTLYRGSPRIDIENEITENFADVRDWGFGFNLDKPRVRHEEVGAVLLARRQKEGGHYADTNARLDWLSLNHFADIGGDDDFGAILSNADCSFMKLGRSRTEDRETRLDVDTPQISVLIGGQVDGPRLGIRGQGGDIHFRQRFALRTRGEYSAVGAMRFALEHQNPFVTGEVRGGSAYPPEQFSLVATDDPDLLLWALKFAEDGADQGVVARLWSMAPDGGPFTLRMNGGIARARRVTHIETDIEEAPLRDGALAAQAAPWQMLTYRLQPAAN